ncbi:Polyadenylation and cleavage factor [Carex littledalei]|uniref:Polyadenylation and cleavage factor n=1 Tax=Carex littledalei TaxID=544730 RepID=A0A833R134_9POAL|nr:Polyadenylation and cleavage factor [Carex littledalei]
MEEERYSNPNLNPSSQNKVPAPSILLGRFQSMVRERDDEMRNRNPNQSPPPLDMIEIVSFYEELLGELAFNSKPIITELTILAGNQRAFAEGIADAICTRISEVAPDQKLPSLYLLDSIVKNIGGEYIRPFTARLPEVFIGAWSRVHPSQHPSMRHLFKTWSQVFPSSGLRKIEDALQFNSSSSSGTGYQQQQVTGPVRQAQSDSPVDLPCQSRIHVNPMYSESPHQLNQDVSLQFPSRRSSILPPPKPPSPIRIGIRRSRSPPPDLYTDRLRNGYRVQNPNPRDLIDAYGGDNRKIQRLENGREWKRSEEEFLWENMSPTFSDRVRREQRERIGLYGPVSGLVGSRPDSRPVEPSCRSWPRQGRLGPIDEQVYVLEERKPISSFGDTVAYKKNEGSIASHFEPIPYQHPSLNHVHESSRLPPYTGSMHMQANHGALHHVRPPHNPAVVTRVMPPPLNAPHSSSVNSIRQLAPKPDYMRSAADTSLDVNKPSLFVPTMSAGTVPVPVPVPVAGHVPARQPILIRHTQGITAPTEALPQLLQPQLHAGVVSAPLPGNISMMPPLPPGPPPSSSAQTGPTSLPTGPTQSSSSPPGSFSGLLSTLMAQGIISLKPQQTPSEDALGFDFNLDLLKVRNESAINALYSELPRQCTTCGVRFQHQDEHSAHMDWHVTKNRVARNRKQKPSRKWYVSANEWLRGAETIGTEAFPVVPAVETEKEEEVEVAVPADENQTACALCGEPFEDFYSDETEEWMYKGAVFMNGTDGSGASTGTGPIVHAKCRSESTNA